jgi:hypothetical protein
MDGIEKVPQQIVFRIGHDVDANAGRAVVCRGGAREAATEQTDSKHSGVHECNNQAGANQRAEKSRE